MVLKNAGILIKYSGMDVGKQNLVDAHYCRVALAQLDPPTFEPKRAVRIVHLNATLAFSSEGE